MSHEIDETTGQAAIAYVGEAPWHGLGQELKAGASIEEWQKAAGMDWEIQRLNLFAMQKEGSLIGVPGYKSLTRSDTKMPLSVVADTYKPVQPKVVLEFFRDLVEGQGMELETAGVLRQGRKFWALAKLGINFNVGDARDGMKTYLLLATSADRTMATRAQLTTVRVVCANTLGAAVGNAMGKNAAESAIKVNHNLEFDPTKVKIGLGLAQATMGEFQEQATKFAGIKLDRDQSLRYFASVLLKEEKQYTTEELESDMMRRRLTKLDLLFKNGPGASLPSADGTLWGAMNAVTRYVDHEVRSQSRDNRLHSAWFGMGANMKQRAWDSAAALAA